MVKYSWKVLTKMPKILNDFLGQLAKTFVKCSKKGLTRHPCSLVQKEKKSCENKEGKSFQVVLFRYRHLMSRIWIGNEFGELPYDYSTFWQGSLLQLKIIGWKKIGSLFNLLWHKTNMTEISTPILTIFTVNLVVEFQ